MFACLLFKYQVIVVNRSIDQIILKKKIYSILPNTRAYLLNVRHPWILLLIASFFSSTQQILTVLISKVPKRDLRPGQDERRFQIVQEVQVPITAGRCFLF